MAITLQVILEAVDKASGPLGRVKGAAGKLGSVAGKALRAGALAGGVAIAGLGAAAVTMAVKFESAMAEVKTLLPEISDKAFGKLKQGVLDVSKEFGIAADKAVPALYQAISAGVPPENVMEFLRVSAKSAIGGVTDLETAVDGITSVVNAYGSDIINATDASNQMFTAVKLGKTNFEELSASLFNVIPTAASMNVKFGDIAASLATMTAAGTPTSVATTQLRQALVEASKSGTDLDKAIRQLTDKSFAELMEAGKSMPSVFEKLRKSMPEQEFKDLFGSTEAMNAALQITGPNFAKTAEAMKAMEKSGGAVDDAFGTIAETASFKFNRSLNLLKTSLLEVGLRVLPKLTQALEVVAPWLEKNLPVAIRAIEDGFRAIRPAIDAFILGAQTIMEALRPVVEFIIDNKPVLIAALVAIGAAVLIAFGPGAVAIAALVGLITLVGLIRKHWESWRDAMVGILKGLRDKVMGVINGLRDWLRDNWKKIVVGALAVLFPPGAGLFLIVTNFGKIKDKVLGIVTGIVGGIKGKATALYQAGRAIFISLKDGFRAGINAAISTVERGINYIIDRWNALEFKLPKVSLGPLGSVGGGSIGTPNVSRISIPRLDEGGRILRTGLAVVDKGETFSGVGGSLGGPVTVNYNTPFNLMRPADRVRLMRDLDALDRQRRRRSL